MNNLVTVIFSTFNGEYTLKRMLNSLEEVVQHTEFPWNIIVVDNNSTDNTNAILRSYQKTLPIEILTEIKAGKNISLNKAIADKAKLANYIIFTDDDVIFPPNILNDYKILMDQYVEFDVFGGKVSPCWTVEPSKNLLLGIDTTVAFAITNQDAGYILGPIEGTKIHGPNMAVRKSIFNSGITFNEKVGPNGGNYVMGSETEFLRRLVQSGHKAFFTPQIDVGHIIRPWQLETKWLASRAFKAGRSLVMHQLKNKQPMTVPTITGYPRWALFQYFLKNLRRLFTSNSGALGYSLLWQANHLKGYCAEYKVYMSSISKAAK
jgi:glycosyltransferase involved in cell wall biosynthesis